MDQFWQFADGHPTALFFLACVAAWIVVRPFHLLWLAYNRHLRAENIRAHGWPKAPTDADGDIVYEKDH